jgi:hypothetical protein
MQMANVTGFDSSIANPSQTLTVTVGEVGTTYTIAIKAAPSTIDNSVAVQKQRELTGIFSVIPSIAGIALSVVDLTNSLLPKQKCVKGKKTKSVKFGSKCPKGYKKKK